MKKLIKITCITILYILTTSLTHGVIIDTTPPHSFEQILMNCDDKEDRIWANNNAKILEGIQFTDEYKNRLFSQIQLLVSGLFFNKIWRLLHTNKKFLEFVAQVYADCIVTNPNKYENNLKGNFGILALKDLTSSKNISIDNFKQTHPQRIKILDGTPLELSEKEGMTEKDIEFREQKEMIVRNINLYLQSVVAFMTSKLVGKDSDNYINKQKMQKGLLPKEVIEYIRSKELIFKN